MVKDASIAKQRREIILQYHCRTGIQKLFKKYKHLITLDGNHDFIVQPETFKLLQNQKEYFENYSDEWWIYNENKKQDKMQNCNPPAYNAVSHWLEDIILEGKTNSTDWKISENYKGKIVRFITELRDNGREEDILQLGDAIKKDYPDLYPLFFSEEDAVEDNLVELPASGQNAEGIRS